MKKIMLIAGTLDAGDLPYIIKENLEAIGYEVSFFAVNEDSPFIDRLAYIAGINKHKFFLKRFSKTIYKKVKEFNPDYVMVYGSNWCLLPETIDKIKKNIKCKVMLWEGNIQMWRWFQISSLPRYDYIFLNDSYPIPILEGPMQMSNVYHMPFNMCDTNWHSAPELNEEDIALYRSDVGFIGMGHPERRDFFENLVDYDLKLWGKKWDNSDKLKPFFNKIKIGFDEKLKVYCCAKININIQAKKYQINGISSKMFEIAACGGFFLTEYKPDIEEFFSREIIEKITYRSMDELKEKIDYYLKNEKQRLALAKEIHDITVSKHTFANRLKVLMNIVESSVDAS